MFYFKILAFYILSDPSFQSKFPNDTGLTYDNVKKRIAAVNIFFNEICETVITEECKMTPLDIIYDFGGILALCLGKKLFF